MCISVYAFAVISTFLVEGSVSCNIWSNKILKWDLKWELLLLYYNFFPCAMTTKKKITPNDQS